MNYNFEKDVEKRFRDQKGILNRPFQEVCRLTRAEADEYYLSGQWYSIKGREYQCIRYQNSIKFIERDEKFVISCNPEAMGSFLPDVASPGMEIIKINSPDISDIKKPIAKYCEKKATIPRKELER